MDESVRPLKFFKALATVALISFAGMSVYAGYLASKVDDLDTKLANERRLNQDNEFFSWRHQVRIMAREAAYEQEHRAAEQKK